MLPHRVTFLTFRGRGVAAEVKAEEDGRSCECIYFPALPSPPSPPHLRPGCLLGSPGPLSRVARWSDGAMSVDQWVDAIPFSETREYVQAVLAYDVIYRIRSRKSATILREEEAAVQY